LKTAVQLKQEMWQSQFDKLLVVQPSSQLLMFSNLFISNKFHLNLEFIWT